MKNKYFFLLYILLPTISGATGGPAHEVTSFACIGGNVPCDYRFTTVDALFTYDTSRLIPHELGRITGLQKLRIEFPVVGTKVIYSFIPTVASVGIQDKPMKLLIVAFDIQGTLAVNMPPLIQKEALAGKKQYPKATVMYKFYRQLESQTDWTEVVTTFAEKPIFFQEITLDEKGTISWIEKSLLPNGAFVDKPYHVLMGSL